jgi:hypothetical protein
MFDICFCLVSQQAAPNYLPLLDPELKPKKVVLLTTDQMQKQGNFLEQAIKKLGIAVENIAFKLSNNFDQMQNQWLDVLAQYEGQKVALNATGGNKWMSITAQEIFRMNQSLVFYVDIDSGYILFLDSDKTPKKLDQKISVQQYLETYGYRIENSKKTTRGILIHEENLCAYLIQHVTKLDEAVSLLNKYASIAEKQNNLKAAYTEKFSDFIQLLKECQAESFLTFDNHFIYFKDESSRQFLNGGWLEVYINALLNPLKKEGFLQDSPHLNAEIIHDKNIKNELDVVFMAKNRLHLIECKTKNFTDEKANETLYKLDSISALGGLGTKAMLVSYKKLSKADEQRAKDLRIKIIQHEELARLKDRLREWILG